MFRFFKTKMLYFETRIFVCFHLMIKKMRILYSGKLKHLIIKRTVCKIILTPENSHGYLRKIFIFMFNNDKVCLKNYLFLLFSCKTKNL